MMQRTNIYLENEDIGYYKNAAKRCGISMSEAIREDLRQQRKLDGPRGSNWAKSLLEMAKKAKPNKDGLTDVSRRHDYYLYEYDINQKNARKKK
ncbi:MAG: hypothetical protein NT141_02575 [candidate division WWE3 bacterium]|nr:hypothetical protein [candidate division WWE3 bacterium]